MAPSTRTVLKFHFGPLLVARCPLRLRIVDVVANPESAPATGTSPDMTSLAPGEHGFLFRSLPISKTLQKYAVVGDAVRYAPKQFERRFIDLTIGHEAYLRRFSPKTRATLQRKVRKFFELPGKAEFRSYRSPPELQAFHAAARGVSALTYQERLLDAGLPDTAEFIAEMLRLAATGDVRAYMLFLDGKPVSYLYCPSDGPRLIYAFLGFDPEQTKHSPGTVLQMLALSELFEERRFTTFDLMEGDGEHKRLFSTHSVQSSNVYFLRRSALMRGLVLSHLQLEQAGTRAVQLAESLKLKSLLQQKLRQREKTRRRQA